MFHHINITKNCLKLITAKINKLKYNLLLHYKIIKTPREIIQPATTYRKLINSKNI